MRSTLRRPGPTRGRWQLAIGTVVVCAALYWVDRRIGAIEQGGPYRQAIRDPVQRAQKARGAEHVVLGCSTSNWFPPVIARHHKLPNGKVVDAHMSDCHQSCTMAEARALGRLGLHYRSATFGVNMFEYCEKYRARRSMQEVALLPFDESLHLLPIYLQSSDRLQLAGGWLLNHLSQVYGNTMWLQRHHRKSWFGNPSLSGNWFRKSPPVPAERGEAFKCNFLKADRDYGLAATRAAVEAALELADEVYLVALPDKVYSDGAPSAAEARDTFLAEHAELVQGVERAHFIDLFAPSVAQPRHFRDNAHLNRVGIKAASKLLESRLSEAALTSTER